MSCVVLQPGEIKGILPYIAPEVLQGKPFEKTVDIYSLGVIMAEMTTGRRAFDGYKFDAG
ncbi:8353_t:CDS:1, partial [Cetraspora pellucida]